MPRFSWKSLPNQALVRIIMQDLHNTHNTATATTGVNFAKGNCTYTDTVFLIVTNDLYIRLCMRLVEYLYPDSLTGVSIEFLWIVFTRFFQMSIQINNHCV